MTKQEIFDEPIWPSRLIFNAKLLFGKAWKDCNEQEQIAIRARILDIDKNEIE
jgi:hypothetical protein